MMLKKLLLYTERPASPVFFAALAEATNSELEVANDLSKALVDVQRPEYIGFLVEPTTMRHIAKMADFSTKKNLANKIHLIASMQDAHVIEMCLETAPIGNCIMLKGFETADAARYYAQVMKLSESKEVGLRALIEPEGGLHLFQFSSAMQKGLAATAVESHIKEFGCSDRIASSIASAVDELLLNAIYEAPVNKGDAQRSEAKAHPADVDTNGVEMQVGFQGDTIGITVIDQHGSLSRPRTLRYLARYFCGEEMRSEVTNSLSSAGLGLSMILDAGGSLCISCRTGERTEVTALFRRALNFREFKNQFQFFSTYIF